MLKYISERYGRKISRHAKYARYRPRRREDCRRGVAFDDTALATLKGGRHRFDEIQGTAFTVQRKTVG